MLSTTSLIAKVSRKFLFITNVFFSFFSSLYYGNAAGLRANFLQKYSLSRKRTRFKGNCIYLASPSLDNDFCNAQLLQQYGYSVLGNIHQYSLLSKARILANSLFNDDQASHNVHGNQVIIKDAHTYKEFCDLFSPQIYNVLLNYYKCAFSVHTVRVWRNLYVQNVDHNRAEVMSNTFHNDNYPLFGLRVFVYLTDNVNKDSGAFRFHNKSSTKALIRQLKYLHRYVNTSRTIKSLTDPASLQYLQGDLGHTAVVNTQLCLHAASVPSQGTYRDMLQFEIYPIYGSQVPLSELFSSSLTQISLRASH